MTFKQRAGTADRQGTTGSLYYGYIVVVAAFIIAVVAEGLLYSFGIFFKPLLDEFGWTRAVTSGAYSLIGLVKVPVAFIAGALCDRFGSKQVLAASGVFIGLGILLLSRVNEVWQIYLFYGVLVGIGISLYWTPLVAIIPRWFFKKRVMMMAVVTTGIGIGQLTLPPLANWLITLYDWRTAALIIGSVSTGIIVVTAQFVRNFSGQDGLSGSTGREQSRLLTDASALTMRQAIRTRKFWLYCGMFIPWMFGLSTVAVHGVAFAIGIGISPASAANMWLIIGVTGIIARLLTGHLSERVGMKPVLVVSFVFMPLAFLSLLATRDVYMFYLFAFLFAIGYGAFEILQSPIVAELFGITSLGAIFGIALSISSVGVILGPVVAGRIFDITGSYQIAFLICAAMALFSLFASLSLPLPHKRF